MYSAGYQPAVSAPGYNMPNQYEMASVPLQPPAETTIPMQPASSSTLQSSSVEPVVIVPQAVPAVNIEPEKKTAESANGNGHKEPEKSAESSKESQMESGKAPEPEPTPPQLSLWQLFLLFLNFGCNAFGGPVVQIAMLKERLVVKEKWISLKRFNRIFAMYQALPGPEAMELCCFFGLVARGRVGALLAGMGFILPGFLLCLLFSWLYTRFNLFENEGFLRSFNCVRAVIPALIVRSVHKIGEGALQNHEKKELDPILGYFCFFGALLTVFNTPFFIVIVYTGLVHVVNRSFWHPKFNNDYLAFFLTTLAIVLNIIYISIYDLPSGVTTASGLITGDLYGTTFVTGLLAGLLTFGGAYTAIPFVRQSVVVSGKWMTDQVFLDGIALVNCLPTPLVMFVCFDGFYVDRVTATTGSKTGMVGAVLMTLGIFLPAFSFTVVFHDVFEKAMESKLFLQFLDGVGAGVVGLIVQTSWTLIAAGVRVPMDALVFIVGLMIVYTYRHRLTASFVIGLAALSGQVLYNGLSPDIGFVSQLHNTSLIPFNFTSYGFRT